MNKRLFSSIILIIIIAGLLWTSGLFLYKPFVGSFGGGETYEPLGEIIECDTRNSYLTEGHDVCVKVTSQTYQGSGSGGTSSVCEAFLYESDYTTKSIKDIWVALALLEPGETYDTPYYSQRFRNLIIYKPSIGAHSFKVYYSGGNIYGGACAQYADPIKEINVNFNVNPLPCVAEAGQAVIFDRFAAGSTISSSTLTYTPLRYCGSPVVVDDTTLSFWNDCLSQDPLYCDNILTKLNNNQPYVIPTGKQVGLFYLAQQTPDMTQVCQQGESFVVKEGICINTLSLVTPCVNGVLDSKGTCITQGITNYVCPGQIEVLANGTQICNIQVPVRYIYTCDGVTITDPVQCTTNLVTKITCGGIEVQDVSECTTDVSIKYTCADNSIVDSPEKCPTEEVSTRYQCSDGSIVDKVDKCPNVAVTPSSPTGYGPKVYGGQTQTLSSATGTTASGANVPTKSNKIIWGIGILALLTLFGYSLQLHKKMEVIRYWGRIKLLILSGIVAGLALSALQYYGYINTFYFLVSLFTIWGTGIILGLTGGMVAIWAGVMLKKV